jgi:hypothetical protein
LLLVVGVQLLGFFDVLAELLTLVLYLFVVEEGLVVLEKVLDD